MAWVLRIGRLPDRDIRCRLQGFSRGMGKNIRQTAEEETSSLGCSKFVSYQIRDGKHLCLHPSSLPNPHPLGYQQPQRANELICKDPPKIARITLFNESSQVIQF